MTTMNFSRSQEALLKMLLSFMTLYLYKPEVRKDVGGTENALAGILERKYKIKDHGINKKLHKFLTRGHSFNNRHSR